MRLRWGRRPQRRAGIRHRSHAGSFASANRRGYRSGHSGSRWLRWQRSSAHSAKAVRLTVFSSASSAAQSSSWWRAAY